jgi:hypothetical protein
MALVIDADGKAWCGSSHLAEGENVGRNDPCPCGSGKKNKRCCALREPQTRKCRVCECSETNPCVKDSDTRLNPGERYCYWVAPDLCSSCTPVRMKSLAGGQ